MYCNSSSFYSFEDSSKAAEASKCRMDRRQYIQQGLQFLQWVSYRRGVCASGSMRVRPILTLFQLEVIHRILISYCIAGLLVRGLALPRNTLWVIIPCCYSNSGCLHVLSFWFWSIITGNGNWMGRLVNCDCGRVMWSLWISISTPHYCPAEMISSWSWLLKTKSWKPRSKYTK